MLFVGTYEHTIDAKQRLAIPSDVRDRLDPEVDGQAFYAVVIEGPTLAIYTERGFEKRSQELDHSERSPEEILAYEQMFFAHAARVELDKQGRIRLPEHLMRLANVGRDVVLIGVKDHLQVHDREAWQARVEQLMKQPDLLMNPRRAMRAKDGPNAPTQ